MSLKYKEELHNKLSGACKASSDAPTTSRDKLVSNEEISLMVRNFNKLYKHTSKDRSSNLRNHEKRSPSHDRNCYNCGRHGHYSYDCMTPHKKRDEFLRRKDRRDESSHRERRNRDDSYE